MIDYRKLFLDFLATLGFRINCQETNGYRKMYRLMVDEMGNAWKSNFLEIDTSDNKVKMTFCNGMIVQFISGRPTLFKITNPIGNSLETDKIYHALQLMHEILLQSNYNVPVYFKDLSMTLHHAHRLDVIGLPEDYWHIPNRTDIIGVRQLRELNWVHGGIYYLNYKGHRLLFGVHQNDLNSIYYIQSPRQLTFAGNPIGHDKHFNVYRATWQDFYLHAIHQGITPSLRFSEAINRLDELGATIPIWVNLCEMCYGLTKDDFTIVSNDPEYPDITFSTVDQFNQHMHAIQNAAFRWLSVFMERDQCQK